MSEHLTETDFEPGQLTDEVWCGDFITKCEFIRPLTGGGLLFWDTTDRIFRRAYWERIDGQYLLNGWECSKHPFSK